MEEQKDLSMLNREVPKKSNGLLIVLLLLFIACICVGSYMLGKSFYKDKQTETPVETKKEDNKKEKEEEETQPEEQSFREQLSYDVDQKLIERNLLKPTLIDFRTINIKKYGYYKNKPSVIYYTISGLFRCKEESDPANETTCLYQSQLGDPDSEGRYAYSITVATEKVDGKVVVGEITELIPDENFVEINEEVLD
jgi:hypothetical protein